MKLIWTIIIGAFIVAMYYTPQPMSNQTNLQYIMADDSPWQVWLAYIIMYCGLVAACLRRTPCQ